MKLNPCFPMICCLIVLAPVARGATLLWTKTLIQLAVFVSLLIFAGISVFKKRNLQVKSDPMSLPLLAMAGLVLATAFLSKYPDISFGAIFMFLAYWGVYLLSRAAIQTRRQERVIVLLVIATAVLTSVMALLREHGVALPLWIYADLTTQQAGLSGPYGNHNHFSGYLEMAVPMVIGWMAARRMSWEGRTLSAGILVLLLGCLALSLSRGGMISILAALLFMAWASMRLTPGRKGRKRLGAFLWVPICGLLVLTLVNTGVSVRMGSLAQERLADDLSFRPKVWERSLDMIRAHPLTGTGPGTFAREFVGYVPAGFDVLPAHAHNDLLEFTAETGLAFPLVCCWLLAAFFRAGMRKAGSKSRQARGVALGAMGAVFAILVHSLVDFNLHIPANALTFAVLAALVTSPVKKKSAVAVAETPGGIDAGNTRSAGGVPRLVPLAALGAGCLAAAAWLGVLLFSRYAYDRGGIAYETGNERHAATCFSEARDILNHAVLAGVIPDRLTQQDRLRIHTGLGKAWYGLAKKADSPEAAYACLRRGAVSLKWALDLDDGSYDANAWMARTLAWMEELRPAVVTVGKASPHQALPFFLRAAELRPTGITIHYDLIRYLGRYHLEEKIPELAFHIAGIFPAYADSLLQESFCTPEVRNRIRLGLLAALKADTAPRQALLQLSDMALADGAFPMAVSYYRQALAHRPGKNRAGHRIHLGMLCLKQGDPAGAGEAFTAALKETDDFSRDLSAVFDIYVKTERLTDFPGFVSRLERSVYPSAAIQLIKAEHLMATGRPKAAKALLEGLNKTQPNAGAYHLLAAVARSQGDWGAMASAARNAVKLAPGNSMYWLTLSRALENQGRLSAAEKAATRSIGASARPDPLYPIHRAGLRLKLGRFRAALADAAAAAAISPDDSVPYYLMARGYLGLEQADKVRVNIDKALKLAPENVAYKRFRRMYCGGDQDSVGQLPNTRDSKGRNTAAF